MMPLNMSADGTTMQQADERLMVRFYLMEQLNEARTREAGMNKYDDMEMVEIIIPGNRDNCIRRASDQDKHRFRRQYEAFLNSGAEKLEGTPLSHFPFISPGERKELEYCNIYTGEGLVGLQDIYIDKIPMDVRPLIQKVKAFMAHAKDASVSVQYAAENAELKNQMALLQEQMSQILKMKEPQADVEAAAPKRGRPWKTTDIQTPPIN